MKRFWWIGAVVLVVVLGTWSPTRKIEHPVDTPWPLLSSGPAADVSALDGQRIALTGFMYPLDQGRAHKHFLLSAHPLGCSFHAPPDARAVVEIVSADLVRFTYEPVMVQGTFAIDSTETSVAFRIVDASTAEF